jgi:hypothetical protein
MSIKYNSVADIPEDLVWIIGEYPEWLNYHFDYVRKFCSEGCNPFVSHTNHPRKNTFSCKQYEAAKECLARCEGINIRNSDEALGKELKVYPEGEAVKWEVGGTVRIIDDIEPDSLYADFAGKEVQVLSVFNDSDDEVKLFAFQHDLLGYGCLTIRAIEEKTEAELAAEKAAKELQCEVDKINAYLDQIDSNLSDYDIQMFAQYVQDRIKGSE